MGCAASITAKTKNGRLIIAKATLRHNHNLIPRGQTADLLDYDEPKVKPYAHDTDACSSQQGEESDHHHHNHPQPPIIDRMEVVDSLFQRLRDRALSKSNPKWFSAFIDLLVDVDQATDDPAFPTSTL